MLPQLDFSTYTGQFFWLCVTFAALYIGIARAVLPRMRSVLQQRAFRIESDMQKAEEFRKEAETILAEYNRMLDDTKSSASTVVEQAREKADAHVAAEEAQADAAVRTKIQAEYDRIDAFRADAKHHIETSACSIADTILTNLSLKETATTVNKTS